MSISGQGWEILIERLLIQKRPSDGKIRTVGRYQVFNDGTPVPDLFGTTADRKSVV